MATDNAVRRPVPDNYSALFPGRFLKADMFKGKKVTLTIKAIFGEDMTDAEDQTKAEWIVQFVEKPFEWVMNKTGAYCLFRMWGGNPQSWIGHKVTLFPKAGTWFGEKGEAIRVWGSPELTEDIPITLKFMRKKTERNMVMHRVEITNRTSSAPAQPSIDMSAVDPKIVEAFDILDYTTGERNTYLAEMGKFTTAQILADLNAKIDARDI